MCNPTDAIASNESLSKKLEFKKEKMSLITLKASTFNLSVSSQGDLTCFGPHILFLNSILFLSQSVKST